MEYNCKSALFYVNLLPHIKGTISILRELPPMLLKRAAIK
jgi:hypothetical protein